MKHALMLVLTGFFLLAGGGIIATASQPQPASAPHAEFPQTEYKFDKVVDGTLITHDFKIKNTGKGTLEISKVKTG